MVQSSIGETMNQILVGLGSLLKTIKFLLKYLELQSALCVGAALFLTGCGAENHNGRLAPKTNKEFVANDDSDMGELGMLAATGKIKFKSDTFLKAATVQSSKLKSSEKCAMKEGGEIYYVYSSGAKDNHIYVELDGKADGCTLQKGYLYREHIVQSTQPLYSVVVGDLATRLKKEAKDSSELSPKSWCEISANTRIALASSAKEVPGKHLEVDLRSDALTSCPIRHGFLYVPHLDTQGQNPKQPPVDDGGIYPREPNFARVMKHILLWEGGCSDDADDPGGRTFMGITTERARLNGWKYDVCKMPRSQVEAIYFKDYWTKRPSRFAWPLNLAVMNTEVNSGGGKAQEFLQRMDRLVDQDGIKEKAEWFVAQQTQYYHAIAQRNPQLRKFLTGWLNRSRFMQGVIAGKINLVADGELDAGGHAKAYDFPDDKN